MLHMKTPTTRRAKLWIIIKNVLGFATVYDGAICWFSKEFWDTHDYYKSKGGDGYPSHFYTYRCHVCGEKFII